MLELAQIGFTIRKDGEELPLLQNIGLKVHPMHFMAIVGPSGCGKTTLLKTIAGINLESEGEIFWQGRNLGDEGDFQPNEIGYVPQFSIAYNELNVAEAVLAAAKLRIGGLSGVALFERVEHALNETGLAEISERRVAILSGGQLRRLGLAMELVAAPHLLLCDEVTSGLDPGSEKEIVQLLHALSRRDQRTVISVTHSLAHFELYDSVLVLKDGQVVFHGPPKYLNHYFGIEDSEQLYAALKRMSAPRWAALWAENRAEFEKSLQRAYERTLAHESAKETQKELLEHNQQEEIREHALEATEESEQAQNSKTKAVPKEPSESDLEEEHRQKKAPQQEELAAQTSLPEDAQSSAEPRQGTPFAEPARLPNPFSQCLTLLNRRWLIFFRDRGQVFLQLAIILCFPLLVTLFSERGKDQVSKVLDLNPENFMESRESEMQRREDQLKVGSDVSGIIMIQVILLALMGSNNASREIAGERLILEKEKLGGVSTGAYLASKLVFLSALVLIQSLWMAFFVEFFWPFRGEFLHHALFLFLMNASMTAICLGISALMKTSAQASLLAIYFVGFQLPLSGAVLALPELVETIVQPLISAYWAWCGSVKSLGDEGRAAVEAVSETKLYDANIAAFVLLVHVIVGLAMTLLGVSRKRWPH